MPSPSRPAQRVAPLLPTTLLAASALLSTHCAAERRIVTFETWEAELAEIYDETLAPRRSQTLEAMSTLTSDVVCIQGVWRDSDKSLLADRAGTVGYRAAYLHSDLRSAPEDARDQAGRAVSTPLTDTAACANVDTFAPAADCMVDRCATIPSNPDSTLNDGRCVAQYCFESFANLLMTSPACVRCADLTLRDSTYRSARAACLSDPYTRYAYEGQNDLLLLSRFDVRKSTLHVLPSTDVRVAALEVELDVPNYGPLTVYCARLNRVYAETQEIYVGTYGNGNGMGQNDRKAWAEEQLLEAQRLSALVARQKKAVLLVQPGASQRYDKNGTMQVAATEDTRSIDHLLSTFRNGVTAEWEPTCTHGSTPPTCTWFSYIMLSGIRQEAVVDTKLTFNEQLPAPISRLLGRGAGLRSSIDLNAP